MIGSRLTTTSKLPAATGSGPDLDSLRARPVAISRAGEASHSRLTGQQKQASSSRVDSAVGRKVVLSSATGGPPARIKSREGHHVNLAVAEGATLEAICDVLLTEGEIKSFIEAFNEFVDDTGERSGDARVRIREDRAKVERELSNIKRAIVEGADSRSFAHELRERQEMLDSLDAELASLDAMCGGEKITYDPAKLATWVKSLRNNLLSADFDSLREMVRRFVKGITIHPDKRAEMTWDPQAVLSLADGPKVPATAMMVMKNGCGGPHDPLWEIPCDEVILALPDPKSKEKSAFSPERPEPPKLTPPDRIVQLHAAKEAAKTKDQEVKNE